MFDRYQFPAQRVTENVTVEKHEHRAPTDDSVKLLREMEAAARAKIIDSIDVSSNRFSGVVHLMQDMASQKIMAECVFSMNGEKMTAKASMPKHSTDLKRNLAQSLRDEVARKIADHLVFDAMERSDIIGGAGPIGGVP